MSTLPGLVCKFVNIHTHAYSPHVRYIEKIYFSNCSEKKMRLESDREPITSPGAVNSVNSDWKKADAFLAQQ